MLGIFVKRLQAEITRIIQLTTEIDPRENLATNSRRFPKAAYFVEKLVGEIGDLGGLSSKRGLHSG
jgi:hypothetical protein